MGKENKLFEMLMTDEDAFTDEDKAALEAEATGAPTKPAEQPPAAPDAVEEPIEQPETEVVEPETPETVVEAEAEPAEPAQPEKPKKKLTGANARIAELVEERNAAREEARKHAEAVAAEREKWARLEERQKLIREAEAQRIHEEEARQAAEIAAQARATMRPDPTLDPQGAELFDLKERVAQQEEQIRRATQAAQNEFNQMRVNQDVNQFTSAWKADLTAFQSAHPDYMDAAKFATEQRIKQWQNLGVPLEGENGAKDRTHKETVAIAAEALHYGRSPSEFYYGLAKQWGWNPLSSEQPKVVQPGITAKEKLAQIGKGQRLTGLSSSSPNVATQDDTDIESMTQEQFATMPEELWLKIEGNPQLRARMSKRIQQWEGF